MTALFGIRPGFGKLAQTDSAMNKEKEMTTALEKIYPEIRAGGFTRHDGTIQFYSRVNALLDPSMRVMDYGAGRAAWTDDQVHYRRELRNLQGKVSSLVAVDVDDAVRENVTADEVVVVSADAPLPFDDSSFDLVVSDHTLEHVTNPLLVGSEIARVLRQGGWLCARTPYRWGSTGLAANAVPNRLHVRLLTWLQPGRREVDVFPTVYRLNSPRQIREAFPRTQWAHASYLHTPEPGYFGPHPLTVRAGRLLDKVLPGPVMMIFLQRIGART